MLPLFTVPHAGGSVGEFIGVLRAAGVDLLVDVRAYAKSSKRGFSRTKLALALKQVGIGYVRVRAAPGGYQYIVNGDASTKPAVDGGHSTPEVTAELEQAIQGRRAAPLCSQGGASPYRRPTLAERPLARLPLSRT